MRKSRIFVFGMLAAACMSANAAKPVDLSREPVSILKSFSKASVITFKQLRTEKDFRETTHARLKEMYAGYPVWGGDVIVHTPKKGNAFMNGLLYKDLLEDLGNAPPVQSEKMLELAIATFRHKTGNNDPVSEGKAELLVYVDEAMKAHWTYLVSFLVSKTEGAPHKPTYIIDAFSSHIYKEWDNIQTLENDLGGGFGGNMKVGKWVYDGLDKNFPKLNITRDANTQMCGLTNQDVTVQDRRNGDAVLEFPCAEIDPDHDNVWWAGDFDQVNGGHSPGNDALYVGRVIQDMYMKWYGIPPLEDWYENKPMRLIMRVHQVYYENAYWDGRSMTFGDGYTMFYPLVSLGVGAHEISHGFTEQHSNLIYWSQSGGLNESFSDMAAQAAEFYSVGENTWQIGPEIIKGKGALRYMDIPSTDCNGRTPGNWCSIDKMSQYKENIDVHFSSGIFNRVFYLMASAKGWDTKKAFDVMVQANRFYWTPDTSFSEAACGVLKATKDYNYEMDVVKHALDTVEVNYRRCFLT